MRGRFIALEGGEGAGKSTQAALVGAWLKAAGIPHVVAREPGGTPVGEAIRAVVQDRPDLDVPPESELLLYLAARAAFVRDVVRPALERGEVVVADRFSLSTLAYQGYGRGIPLEKVRAGLDIATDGLEPDLYLLLDLPVERGRDRQQRGGGAPDRIEGTGADFLSAVREGYLALADSEPRVQVLSAEGSPEEVHARVRAILQGRFPETFGAATA